MMGKKGIFMYDNQKVRRGRNRFHESQTPETISVCLERCVLRDVLLKRNPVGGKKVIPEKKLKQFQLPCISFVSIFRLRRNACFTACFTTLYCIRCNLHFHFNCLYSSPSLLILPSVFGMKEMCDMHDNLLQDMT